LGLKLFPLLQGRVRLRMS